LAISTALPLEVALPASRSWLHHKFTRSAPWTHNALVYEISAQLDNTQRVVAIRCFTIPAPSLPPCQCDCKWIL